MDTADNFPESNMVFVMDFLDGYDLLDHVLVSDKCELHPRVAPCLGDFMGKVHSTTHSLKVDAARKEYLAAHFENRPMRDIQLEFVFTKCFNEATEEQRAGLNLTPDFMKEVASLKQNYDGKNTDSLVLSHGDLHPGSIMVDVDGHAKIIDPEFCVYGPPGLDVGSCLR